MKRQLNQLINSDPILDGSLIGMSIRSASTGEIIYDHMGDIRLNPASNLKLFSGVAALSILGENYTFTTEVLTSGKVDEKTLHGNLYIRGKGDPTLLPANIEAFAKEVRKSGIEFINGDIIGDDSWYDDVRLSPDLNWSDEQYYYGAQISALTLSPNTDFDAGTVIVGIKPGNTVGDRPSYTVSPNTNYIEIINKAKTVDTSDAELIIERKHGTNIVVISGTILIDSESIREWVSVWEPTNYVLDIFQQALKNQGISWTGSVKRGKIMGQTEILLSHQSIPLSELLVPFMKLSNNGHGETFIKEVGKVVKGYGSCEIGLEVVETELSKLGVNMSTIMMRDGSGISHFNLIPANELSKLLYLIREKDFFPAFLNSLPIAGTDERMLGGTLVDRMGELSVQAKTGTIHGVSTLSGFVETNKGTKLIFSILINNLLDEDLGKGLEDRIVEIIACYG